MSEEKENTAPALSWISDRVKIVEDPTEQCAELIYQTEILEPEEDTVNKVGAS